MKEIQIQKAIKDYLQILENQGKLMFLRNQAGGYATKEGHYIKMGKKGSPDLLVWIPEYLPIGDDGFDYVKAIAFEVKSKKGKQSPSQIEWQEKFEKIGGKYYIIRSIDDVMEILK